MRNSKATYFTVFTSLIGIFFACNMDELSRVNSEEVVAVDQLMQDILDQTETIVVKMQKLQAAKGIYLFDEQTKALWQGDMDNAGNVRFKIYTSPLISRTMMTNNSNFINKTLRTSSGKNLRLMVDKGIELSQEFDRTRLSLVLQDLIASLSETATIKTNFGDILSYRFKKIDLSQDAARLKRYVDTYARFSGETSENLLARLGFDTIAANFAEVKWNKFSQGGLVGALAMTAVWSMSKKNKNKQQPFEIIEEPFDDDQDDIPAQDFLQNQGKRVGIEVNPNLER